MDLYKLFLFETLLISVFFGAISTSDQKNENLCSNMLIYIDMIMILEKKNILLVIQGWGAGKFFSGSGS